MTIKNLMGIIWKIEALIRYNSLIYGLQKLPVIGKKIPNRCYQIGAFKVLAMLVQFLLIPLQLILSMVLYVLFAWCLSLGIRSWLTAYSWYSSSGTFQTSLVIISLFSLLWVTPLTIKLVSRDSMELARAIGQFHIIPRQYFKASQIMSLAKELIFHVLVLGFYFNVNGYSFWHALYFTVFVSGLRFFLKIVCLRFYDRKAKDKEKSLNRILYSFWGLGLFTSIGVILLGNSFAPWPVFSLYAGISGLIMWAYSFYRLDTYVDLNQLALSVVTHETMKERVASIENLDSLAVKVRNEDIVVSQKKKLKKIDSLSGIAYLNALFLQRLGKHLRKGVIYRLLFLALVIGLEVILLHRYGKDVGPLKQRDFIRILYMSLVSGYLLYVGESYIKFCFYHLDRPLLKFNDYRRRDVIIASLKTRFWSLIRHNLPIFGMVNLGLVILYVSLFPVVFSELLLIVLVQFLSMAFFSLYFLYLYFLLQPFTEGLKSKSFLYTSLTWLVYFGGYQLYRFVESMTLLIFSFMLLGMFVFLVVGFCAVYYLAPKTFRLK